MLATVKSYVAEMGVTDNFYQEMVNTEPSGIRIYRMATIGRLLPETDPTNDEITTANAARRYGITTGEYRRRSAEALSSCTVAKGDLAKIYCSEAMMWGLSESVYRERQAKVSNCRFSTFQTFSDEQLAILDKTPTKQRNALPFVERAYECERNTMLGR
jgi:hypothetical protein